MMGHHEIHKFCDATLKRVLKGLKSYNNDVKHGYVKPCLSNDDAEYMRLFEEEIEERLKHRDQIRRWEMFEDEDENEDKDEIKRLIWVNNHTANKKGKSGHM
ncbi:hypothetical protein Tco_1105086 [Tanacetum coccineum]